MSHLMEVTYSDIERLKDYDLTNLLRRLLNLEVTSRNLPLSSVAVSLHIDVPDGGEDGRVQWVQGPESTNWIPNRTTLFQCKATEMSPSECRAEILIEKTNTLKSMVEEVLDSGGAYVLFYARSCNSRQSSSRIEAIRRALRDAGKSYADQAEIKLYDANRIAEWANQYVAAKVAIIRASGRHIPIGLLTWSTWGPEWGNAPDFVADETITNHISQLRVTLSKPKSVARVVGLSGLGKTRLAFEVFRPTSSAPPTMEMKTLTDRMVYVDCNRLISSSSELPSIMSEWVQSGLDAVVVVDNCGLSLHKELAKAVTRSDSNFSLLTLDYDLALPSEPCIQLEPTSTDVIIGILRQTYKNLPDPDIGRIAAFAQGFPQMATLLAQARLNDEPTIGRLNDAVLLERLVWGRGSSDSTALGVISCLALFESIGFNGDAASERMVIAEKLCRIDPEEFHRHAIQFIRHGIVERKGDYVRVRPMPLAIRLAADWWSAASPEATERLISELPERLLQSLCDQLSKLDFLPEAREFVSKVCGPRAPFGEAEVLNTDWGSRLFRSLVEVNPSAAVAALERAFGKMTHAQLLEVGPGRRNLIWALEKLCFWADTFSTSARLLLAFASAENETWGNNATGQFLQLFHVLLPGTQASLDARLSLIDEASRSAQLESRILAIRALGEALKVSHFRRTGGVESQGSRPSEKDWTPKTMMEVRYYWESALQRLTEFSISDLPESELARQKIAGSIRGMVQVRLTDVLIRSIQEILSHLGSAWPEALEEAQLTFRYEEAKMTDLERKSFEELIEILNPSSISDRLRLIVSLPSYRNFTENAEGELSNRSQEDAERLAEELAETDCTWLEHIEVLFRGEQRQGLTFGKRLALSGFDPEIFLKAALNTLGAIPKPEANPVVLAGFLSGLRASHPDLVQQTLSLVSRENTLIHFLTELTRLSDPNPEDLPRLIKLVLEDQIAVKTLGSFAYGGVLKRFPPQDVMDFCEAILGKPEGASTALHILHMYCYSDPDKQKVCKDLRKRIALIPSILRSPGLEWYCWQQEVLELLDSQEDALVLGIQALDEILSYLGSATNAFDHDFDFIPILRRLLRLCPEEIWRLLSAPLASSNRLLSHEIRHLLGSSGFHREEPVILSIPIQQLIDWCKIEPKGASILASFIPLFSEAFEDEPPAEDEPVTWTPLALELISHFGTRSDVLDELSSNMTTGGFVGSLIPYLKRDILALEQLAVHELPEVRSWASQSINYLGLEIERERKREEEHEIGIW